MTFDGQREKTKADRVKLLTRALLVFTHPARHADEVAVQIEWSRMDAWFAISTAAALINELTSAPDAKP